jgi:hypothetical protein
VVINNTTSQMAMHKDKRLLPVNLTVRKISGIGEDTMCVRAPASGYVCTL